MVTTSSEGIGNVFRLAGLKNVNSKKRRVSGLPDVLEEMNDSEPNLAGIGMNEPIPDVQEGGLAPESYDVRANQVDIPQPIEDIEETNPEIAEEPGVFSRLGSAFAEWLNPQRAQENKEYARQTMESVPKTEFNPLASVGNALKEYITPHTSDVSSNQLENERRQLMQEGQLRSQGINPQEQMAQEVAQKQQQQIEIQSKIDEAQKNPYSTVVYGATDQVANQPDLRATASKILGADFTDQIAAQTAQTEKVLNDIQDNINAEGIGYNEQEQRLKERILSNQASDMDKYYIGLALAMPLLAGAFFGKEAGLGALAGGAKGLSDVYGRRESNARKDEELLADIGYKKSQNELKLADLNMKRMAIPAEIQKGLPEDERAFLKGKNEITWTDPMTGQQKVGIEIAPDLVVLPEFVTSKEELKEKRGEANEIASAMNPTREINRLTSDIIELSSLIKDKTLPGKALSSWLSGKDPGLASRLGEEVEFKGKRINSYIALEQMTKLLVDSYRQMKGMRALTQSVQDHIDGLFRSPTSSFQSAEDTIQQMLYTRDLSQSRLLENAASHGFAPEFVARALQGSSQDLYGKMNAMEGEKESTKLLRE